MLRSLTLPRVVTVLLGGLAVVVLARCTLGTFRPTLTLRFEQATTRDLSGMDNFAVVIRGSLSNTLRTADVGRRSLSCLHLNGQVAFPYTLSQLRQGIQLTIPHGSYEAEIVAFDSVTGSPPTVTAMFSGSASLASFPVAKSSFNTLTSTNVRLTSTYTGGTLDLLPQCPVPQGVVHSIILSEGDVKYLSRQNETWTMTTIDSERAATHGRLTVDEGGVVHVVYGTDGVADYGTRYANNSLGSFSSEIASNASASSPFKGAGLVVLGGTPHVLTSGDCPNCTGRIFEQAGVNSWFYNGDFFSQTSGNLLVDFNLRTGPGINVIGTAIEQSIPPQGYVGTRAGIGASTVLGPAINSDGSNSCTDGIQHLQAFMDPAGKLHAIFLCQFTGLTTIGYGSNRTGPWVFVSLNGNSPYFASLDGYLDPAGFLHISWIDLSNLTTIRVNTADGEFSALENVYNNAPDSLVRAAVSATAPNDAYLLVDRSGSPGPDIILFRNQGGSWQINPDFPPVANPTLFDLEVR